MASFYGHHYFYRTRAERRCAWCVGPVAAGEYYSGWLYVDGNSAESITVHFGCLGAMWESCEFGDEWSEGEGNPEDRDLLNLRSDTLASIIRTIPDGKQPALRERLEAALVVVMLGKEPT